MKHTFRKDICKKDVEADVKRDLSERSRKEFKDLLREKGIDPSTGSIDEKIGVSESNPLVYKYSAEWNPKAPENTKKKMEEYEKDYNDSRCGSGESNGRPVLRKHDLFLVDPSDGRLLARWDMRTMELEAGGYNATGAILPQLRFSDGSIDVVCLFVDVTGRFRSFRGTVKRHTYHKCDTFIWEDQYRLEMAERCLEGARNGSPRLYQAHRLARTVYMVETGWAHTPDRD